MSSVLDDFAALVREHGAAAVQSKLQGSEYGKNSIMAGALFTNQWRDMGAPTFRLDHSLAAMLAVTRSPNLDWQHLPMPCVVVEIPFEYAPVWTDEKMNCKVGLHYSPAADPDGPDLYVLGVFCDAWAGNWIVSRTDFIGSEDSVEVRDNPEQTRAFRHALRVAYNAIRYINEYRDRVEPSRPRKDGTTSGVQVVRPPRDVVIDRNFRLRASELVRSNSFSGARRALAHIVRGHWRNQLVGEGRKERRQTWVRPHMRGDESFGRVVQRIERLADISP